MGMADMKTQLNPMCSPAFSYPPCPLGLPMKCHLVLSVWVWVNELTKQFFVDLTFFQMGANSFDAVRCGWIVFFLFFCSECEFDDYSPPWLLLPTYTTMIPITPNWWLKIKICWVQLRTPADPLFYNGWWPSWVIGNENTAEGCTSGPLQIGGPQRGAPPADHYKLKVCRITQDGHQPL